MRLFTLLVIATLLVGFISPEQQRTINRDHLTDLALGMTKAHVVSLLGDAIAEDFDESGTYMITNPYKTETIKGHGNTYEVLYYHTQIKERDRFLTEDELTPLIFNKKQKMIGWGWTFLKALAKKDEIKLSFMQ